MKIWLRGPLFDYEREIFSTALAARGHQIVSEAAEAEVLATGDVTLSEEEIAAMPALQRVVRFATARADVDAEKALLAARGIDGVIVRGGAAAATAEHAFAMIVSVLRRLPETTEAMLGGGWCQSVTAEAVVRDLREITAGIVGYGEVGRRLANLLRSAGSRVLYTRRHPDASSVSLDDLLAWADVVCLTARSDPAERPLLTRAHLEQLRTGTIVVSVGGGQDLDLAAMKERVDAGELFAALDVFPQEPPDPSDIPRRRGGVVLSPHVAGRSRATARALAENVAAALESSAPAATYLRPVAEQVASHVSLASRDVSIGEHISIAGLEAAFAACGARVSRTSGNAVIVDGRRITLDDVFTIPTLRQLRERWWSDFGVWEQLFERFARSRIAGRTASVIGYATPAAHRIATRARRLGMYVVVVASTPEERLDSLLDGFEAAFVPPTDSIQLATDAPASPPRGLDDEIAAAFLALAADHARAEAIVTEAVIAVRSGAAASPSE